MRRKNGHIEPYRVKDWALGSEIWVGKMNAADYSKQAYQWPKALRLLDPTIQLVSCGEKGFADWDHVTLKTLAPVVDFHSIHSAAADIDLGKIEGNLTKRCPSAGA
ncbi:hypothetical protein C8R44DRAFT_877769 [Mycena epipterygia]|nr:hypothetical protein C8R44DRAFT_877769 [Mycena epipterygia]